MTMTLLSKKCVLVVLAISIGIHQTNGLRVGGSGNTLTLTHSEEEELEESSSEEGFLILGVCII